MTARLAWLLPALPAVAAAALLLSGRRQPGRGGPLACAATAASLVLSCLVLADVHAAPDRIVETTHPLGDAGGVTITVGTRVGGTAAVVAVMVCAVALLVQIYSTAYLRQDPRYPSYAAFVSLFTAAMLLVVLAADLFPLLVGWEVMGFCSYILINHHWERPEATAAGVKAFVVTRFGDLFFTAALIVLGVGAGTFRISGVLRAATDGTLDHTQLTVAGLLLLGGVIGKSAQFPLQTWLPDAMAGPTPISALIHAATMVAAGVYLVGLLYPVVAASAATLDVLAIVAVVTMLGAALAACAQDDLKRVLAYSTVSQLAYMTAGLAVGGYAAGLFHLLTHAAFKALLFLCAGVVIMRVGGNAMSGMGGLRKTQPLVFACTSVGLASLAGVPPFAGFFSKDAVLAAARETASHGGAVPVDRTVAWTVLAAGLATVLVTAAYATRVWLLVFFGTAAAARPAATTARDDPGDEAATRHAPPADSRAAAWALHAPLVVLAVVAATLGAAGATRHGGIAGWLGSPPLPRAAVRPDGPAGEAAGRAGELGVSGATSALSAVLAAVAVLAVVAAWRRAAGRDPARLLGRAAPVLASGFGVDRLYAAVLVRPVRDQLAPAVLAVDERVVDGAVEGTARLARLAGARLRRLQTGNAQAYATGVVLGAVAIAVAVAVGVGR